MSYQPTEELLFIVAMNQPPGLADSPNAGVWQTQIYSGQQEIATAVITEIQSAIDRQPALIKAGVRLLQLENYLNLFVGKITLDSAAIQAGTGQGASWAVAGEIVESLLQAVFSPAALAAQQTNDLTWTLVRVNELTASAKGSFSLLGMKGLGAR